VVKLEKKHVFVDYKIHLLQQVRLIHAIAESGISIVVMNSEKFKFRPLIGKFGMKLQTGNENGVKISSFTDINHELPRTSIGEINRVIIFPRALTEYCRSLWKKKRKYRFSFVGLITESRKVLLQEWVQKNTDFQGSFDEYTEKQIPKNLLGKLLRKTGTDLKQKMIKPDLYITNSKKGRNFPGKSLDTTYYGTLANSEFVLCPSGDYTWSYRFFESILCGAIPVVEETCEAYEGFRFYMMTDKSEDLKWSAEDAIFNYNLCLERIVVSPEDILGELNKIS
jgi:hypothetical protein